MSKPASDTELPTPGDYQMALHAQSACNLSGLVISFASVMHRISNEANAKGHGTEWKNRHPIAVLYSAQIANLTKEDSAYHAAYEECTRKAADKAEELRQ